MTIFLSVWFFNSTFIWPRKDIQSELMNKKNKEYILLFQLRSKNLDLEYIYMLLITWMYYMTVFIWIHLPQ